MNDGVRYELETISGYSHMSHAGKESAPVYQKSLGRPSWSGLRLEAQKRKALRLLKGLSKQYLSSHHKQLAIFSYDLIGHRINLDGVYERENLDLLFEWFAPCRKDVLSDGCAIDIGANIGNHSVYFSRFFKTVFSFEPNPMTFRLLQMNAAVAGNVVCFNAGISSGDRDGLLDVRHHNTGVSKLSETATRDTVSVQLKRLDSCIDAAERVRLIKIDVEGHEAEVLLGSEAVIRKNNPLVIFEQHRDDFSNGTSRSIEILRGYGYRNFAVIERFPSRLLFLPRVIRRLCQSVLRLMLGERREIRIKAFFEPQFYSFIIAVPDWVIAKE